MKVCRHRKLVTLVGSLFAVLAALAFVGCGTQDSASPPPLGGTQPGGGITPGPAPGDPSIALDTPNPSTITAGAAGAEITATLMDEDGLPLAGETVTFSVSPSSVASLSPGFGQTDGNGQLSVVLSGLRAGSASVTASFSGHSSDAETVTVLAPAVAVAAADSTISASSPGTGGTVITASVTDTLTSAGIDGLSVVFTTSLGELTAVQAAGSGQYRVTLTSTESGTAAVSATALGVTSANQEVAVSAGDVDTLTLQASVSQIPPDGKTQSVITVTAADEFGNPLEESVDLRTSLGVLSQAELTLVDGEGTVVLTALSEGVARVTASMGGVDITFVDIAVELSLVGEPASIQIEASAEEITVKGSGGTESATLTATVVDVDGNPIADSSSNLEMVIIDGPRGGENLSGDKLLGQVLTLTTVSGVATANLHSGTLPGTVQVEVRVTKDSRGEELPVPLIAIVPRITVRSGPPASLFLTSSNAIQSPGLAGFGSITHDYLAYVNDRWGNAVPDGTIVFFGQFLNIVQECRNRYVFDPDHAAAVNGYVEETCVGGDAGTLALSPDPVADPGSTFTSSAGQFQTRGISAGDILVILTEGNPNGYGGYRIREVVSDTTLRLEVDFDQADSGLEWAVGNNDNLGGGVFTTEGAAATVGGVARWANTYAGELVNDPSYIHAETEGGVQGHARLYRLASAAPTGFNQSWGPSSGDEVPGGATVVFRATIVDGSPPTPYAITNLLLSVTASAGTLAIFTSTMESAFDGRSYLAGAQLLQFKTTARSILQGYAGGEVAFWWTAPPAQVEDQEYNVNIGGFKIIVVVPGFGP